MARPLRIEFRGAVHHVTARGTGRQLIFLGVADRRLWLAVLRQTVLRFGWELYAYVAVGNHFHLLLRTPEANLARGMRQLNGVYAQRFNRRHLRWGHVFGDRYTAILVERDPHLLHLSRYLAWNPVDAGLCRSPLDWAWGSYRATAGLEPVPDFLAVGELLEHFGGDPRRARRAFRAYVAGGPGVDPGTGVDAGVYLGSRPFVRRRGGGRPDDREIRRDQRAPLRASLSRLLREDSRRSLVCAYREHGYTLRELAAAEGVHYSTISRRIAAVERELGEDIDVVALQDLTPEGPARSKAGRGAGSGASARRGPARRRPGRGSGSSGRSPRP